MIPNYAGCEKCPLKDRPPVYGYGPQNPEFLVLGEAPGQTEVQKGKPFVGKSGQLLRRTLDGLGILPDQVYYTNACLCNPDKNKTPSPKAISCCNRRFLDEISKIQPSKILAVGGSALQALIHPGGNTPITKWRGLGITWTYGIDPTIGEYDIVDTLSAFVIPTYHPAAVSRDPDLFRDFTHDIAKLIAQDAPLPPPEIETLVPSTPDEALDYLEELTTASALSCDLETTGFSPINDVILSYGFGALTPDLKGVSLIIPNGLGIAEDERVHRAIETVITQYDGDIAFHNMKFDLQFLQVEFQRSIEPQHPIDTMLNQGALDERGTSGGAESKGRGYHIHGLKDQARIRYDVPDYHFDFDEFYSHPGVIARVNKIRGLEYVSEDLEKDLDVWQNMFIYQGMDCYVTCRLREDTYEELLNESPKLVELVDNHLIKGSLLFTKLELTGAPVDIPYLEAAKERFEEELKGELTDLQVMAFGMGMVDFNPQSPTQAKKLLEGLGLVTSSTEREVVLLELQRKNKDRTPYHPQKTFDAVHKLMDFRQKAKLLQKDVIGLLNKIDYDGRIRPDYLLHEAATGRIACRDPNLQNVPILIGPIIRNGFIAGYLVLFPDGHTEIMNDSLLLEADESQLELRIAAWLSQDQAMIQTFLDGRDIHRAVASVMFKKLEDQITKHERYLAKYVDFGVVYGRGAKSLTEGWEAQYIIDNLGGRAWTLEEAQKLIDDFLHGFPGLERWIENQHKLVHKNRYVETAMGRRRRFPMIDDWGAVERQAVNTPIQSFGSDLVIAAAIRIDPQLPEGAKTLPIIVHDSIMYLVRRDLIPQVHDIVKRELETPPIPMNVPLRADFKVGWSWGKMVDYEDYDPEVDYANYNTEES